MSISRTTAQPESVFVDDTSTTKIQYSSGWNLQNVSETDGTPLYGSLHVAVSAAFFTFIYNGVGPISIVGSLANLTNSSTNTLPPAWTCVIDNNLINTSPQELDPPTTEVVQCWFNQSIGSTNAGGEHTILVSVQATEDNPAYFDYLGYKPAPGVVSGDLYFEASNSAIQYGGPGWATDVDGFPTTSNPGDTLDFVFNGDSILWRANVNHQTSANKTATASYSIDGASPVNFTTKFPVGTLEPWVTLFQTASYGPGQHHLHVVNYGDKGSVPLSLISLLVQNGTAEILQSTSPISHTHSSHVGVAELAGICVGALGALSIIVLCGCWARRRRARSRTGGISSEFPRPFHYNNRPPPISEKERQQRSATSTSPDVGLIPPPGIRTSKARRLAEATATTFRRDRSRAPGQERTPEVSNDSSPTENRGPSTRRVIMHEDSGVPLRQPEEEVDEVIEIPPAYVSIR